MDVHAPREDDRTLRRIIALLVSFAAIAERCASRSLPVRFLVLWFLRRAEFVATGYVLDAYAAPPSDFAEIAAAGNDPADALLLAARFRALAAVLGALLPVTCPLERRHPRPGTVHDQVLPVANHGLKRAPNDT